MSLLIKQPGDTRAYGMDFQNFKEFKNGDTISSVGSVTGSPSGLTIGSSSASGSIVSFNISGGTSGATYTVTVTLTTSSGAILTGNGTLFINTQPA